MTDRICIGRDWFLNTLRDSIREAIELHGDAARMVGWTVMESFDRSIGRGTYEWFPSSELPESLRNEEN